MGCPGGARAQLPTARLVLQLDQICISFDEGKTTMNFVEAALLIQGSACVYSKKVGPAADLVLWCRGAPSLRPLGQVAGSLPALSCLASTPGPSWIPCHLLTPKNLKWQGLPLNIPLQRVIWSTVSGVRSPCRVRGKCREHLGRWR